MALSIQYWANYTTDQSKLIRKSENAVNSDHVLRFVYDAVNNHVSSVIQASMRDKSYKVEIDLNESYGVAHSSCECPMGNHVCHHVAAALLFGFKRASKTDVKCSWLKHPKSRAKSTCTIEDMFPLRKPDYKALDRPVDDADRNFMYEELMKLGRFSAQQWLLSPEPVSDMSVRIPLIEEKILSSDFTNNPDKFSWLRRQLISSPPLVFEVAKLTTGQSRNPLWSAARKYRITASNFGPVIGAIQRNSFPESLYARLTANYNLENVKSVSWGVTHEKEAISCYQKTCGMHVSETGFWLHESGVLGASPDGLINDDLLLEVKCPYRAKDMTVKEAVLKFKDFFLEMNADKVLVLKKTHQYYHQIQSQLHICGRAYCHLVVWTTKDLELLIIRKDESWTTNLNIMIEFYFHRFLPKLLK